MECYYFVTKEEQYERDVGEHLGHMMLVETVAYLGNLGCAAVMQGQDKEEDRNLGTIYIDIILW